MPENDTKDKTAQSQEDERDESQEDTNASSSESKQADDATPQEGGQDQSMKTESEESKTQEAEDDKDDNADSKESDEDDDEDALVPLAKLKKVRNEAKNLRDRLKTAEARITELEAGGANEDEAKQVEALTHELRMERLSHKIAQEAVKSGAIEPSAVAKLIDLNSVTWENNAPTNIEAVLKAARESFPKLFVPVTGTGNVGNRSERGGQDEVMSPSSRLRNAYQ